MDNFFITISSPTKSLHPSASPAMRKLCDKAGDSAEYDIKTNTLSFVLNDDAPLTDELITGILSLTSSFYKDKRLV